MHEIKPAGELAQCLAAFEHMGGVIDFVVMDVDNLRASEYELHRNAALFTLETVDRRLQEKYSYRLTFEPDKMQGQKIALSEFLGPHYDLKVHKLLTRGRTNGFSHQLFYTDDAECENNAVIIDQSEFEGGYAYAFTEPPYSLGVRTALQEADQKTESDRNRKEIGRVFDCIGKRLFGDFTTELDIYTWSTDWSNYFDAGNEWWGSFLWTVHNRRQGFIVGAAASTTD